MTVKRHGSIMEAKRKQVSARWRKLEIIECYKGLVSYEIEAYM